MVFIGYMGKKEPKRPTVNTRIYKDSHKIFKEYSDITRHSITSIIHNCALELKAKGVLVK